jgi:hypothetical protein
VPSALRRRLPAVLGLALACVSGPAFRALTHGCVAKVGGDVLYALGVLALVFLARPRIRVWTAAVVAGAVCAGVEFAQLTPFPAEISRHSTLGRLILGSTFHPADLASYLVGVLLGAGLSIAAGRGGRADRGD